MTTRQPDIVWNSDSRHLYLNQQISPIFGNQNMDILLPDIRDRRLAAADEYLDGNERRERALFNAHDFNADSRPIRRPFKGRFIYGAGTPPRLASESRPAGYDVCRQAFARDADQITTVILHCTDGTAFDAADLPETGTDGEIGSHHRVDEIIAHFLVLHDGLIVYTHDIQHILNDAGGRRGIDIEFAGSFPHDLTVPAAANRLSQNAIMAGRRLVKQLKRQLHNLRYIHPHGQVQRGSRGKFHSCPGPDIWINVGEWAVSALGMTSDETDAGYINRGISVRQRNPAYRQTF